MSNLTGSAVVTKSGDKRIVITRHVDAPRELVWEAHHNPDYMSKWWGLPEAVNHITEVDLRPGGRWRLGQRQADGSEVIFTGKYVELDPPKRVVYTKGWPKAWGGRGGDSVDLEDSVITISFEETATGTVATLTCEFSSEALRDKVAESGMNRLQKSYDRMDDLLATLL